MRKWVILPRVLYAGNSNDPRKRPIIRLDLYVYLKDYFLSHVFYFIFPVCLFVLFFFGLILVIFILDV